MAHSQNHLSFKDQLSRLKRVIYTGSIIVCFLVFISLAIAVHYNPFGLGWEQAILIALHQTRQPILDHWAKTLTDLGIWIITAPILGLIALILTYQQQWQKGAYIAITVLGAIPLSYGLKHLFNRPRPHLWPSDLPWLTNPAFPSGHAFSSMMFVTLIILLWPWRGRTWVVLAGSLFVILIGWTRLYLGVHYPSDILAGWSIAITWCVGIYLIYLQRQSILKDK